MAGRRTLTEAERQASDWIVRMRGDPSAREREEFNAWLEADAANRTAYEALERTWEKIASNPSLKGRVAANDTTPNRPRWRMTALAIAASALLAIGALAWFMQEPARTTAENVQTAPGELRTITLADGSTIELSGGSKVSLQVTNQERRVELTSGYALFDVAHDSTRPFIVHTPQGDIRVLGTSFVVRIAGDEVRTTVLRGSVSGTAQRSGLFAPRSDVITAAVNEEIVLSEGNAELIEINAEVIPRRLAWRENMLAFDGETLNEAIAEVSQQTGWEFELDDPSLGEMRVGGYVHADPEAFIALLSSSLDLEARREGERHVVLARRS